MTDAPSVEAAGERVSGAVGDGGLDGLVNNAGTAIAGPIELLPVDQWRAQIEVNLIGQIAVTRALLPALRRARGRVVFVSSIGGLVRPTLTSLITQATAREEQGVVLGLTQSLNSVSMIIAPPLGGLLIDHGWLTAWGLAASAVAVIGLLLASGSPDELRENRSTVNAAA